MALPIKVSANGVEDAPVNDFGFWLWLGPVAYEEIFEISIAPAGEPNVGAVIACTALAAELVGPMPIAFVESVVVANPVAGSIGVSRCECLS